MRGSPGVPYAVWPQLLLLSNGALVLSSVDTQISRVGYQGASAGSASLCRIIQWASAHASGGSRVGWFKPESLTRLKFSVAAPLTRRGAVARRAI